MMEILCYVQSAVIVNDMAFYLIDCWQMVDAMLVMFS